ncbi:amino acid adenylation domain-containing protein [Streptomyces sp. NPDC091292]|uniref:non-ribosomal peptide synthetase n=1 Tax=Streptomyces sp. NPDC091292 TaxID=3365991 RepID=UPI00382B917F
MHEKLTARGRPTVPPPDGHRFPLTAAQRALWLVEEIHAEGGGYNVPVAVRVRGALDVPALRRAFGAVIERHSVLRSVFAADHGEPYQTIGPATEPELPVVDLSREQPERREPRLRGLLQGWADARFDLTAAGPLVRTGVVRLAPDEHVLAVVMHQLVCDGPSIHLLFDDLATAYAGDPLPALPVQFADYAVRQSERSPDPEDLAWWRGYLTGAPTMLALPADRPRAATATAAGGATHVFTLDGPLMARTLALARRLRVTPFVLTLAAYAALLGRLTGGDDLLIGTPVGGRLRSELDPVIGYFVTTLPVRADLSGGPAFDRLVERVRDSVLDLLSHQEVPFESLVEELAPERGAGHNPLVQTFFTCETEPIAAPAFRGLTATPMSLAPTSAKVDVDLMIVRAAADRDDFEATITYRTDLFDSATIRALADGFRRLLAAAVARPGTPVRSLPLLDRAERNTILTRWHRSAPARDISVPLPELLARRAAATPDAPAVSFRGETLSYAALDARANHLARRLRSARARPESVVGVLLSRGVDLVTALVGVLRSGAAYLPLDPAHPAERLHRLLTTADVGLAVTDETTDHLLTGTGITTLRPEPGGGERPGTTDTGTTDTDTAGVTKDVTDLTAADPEPAPPPIHPSHLAYTLFTSGSTGDPKGVAVEHGALVNHAQAVRDRFRLSSDDRVLQFATVAFDVAAEEIFPTLLAGGCVVLRDDPPPAPTELTALLADESVTVVNLPSGYWQQWQDTLDPDAPFPLAALRLVVIGSEAVDARAVARWRRSTGITLLNAYGLTETTVTATVHTVDGADTAVVPVGRPLDGVEAYVLDAEREPVPPGVIGELYIGGACLARGYLKSPGLTAERFVPHPFSEVPGARLHRTGDLARLRRDGTLEVVGRGDEQIKLRGHRIEPREIEAALNAHPGVVQAAVTVRRDGPGGGRLVGYVVPRTGSTVPAGLLRHLTARLPGYLVPTALVAIEAMPLTPQGKVHRAALPPPPAPDAATDPAPPRNQMEDQVARIWRQALQADRIGVHDNFFDLGGTSFTLAAVHRQLTELLGRPLPLVALFEHPTVAALAGHLQEGAAPGPEHPAHHDGADDEARGDRLRDGRARLRAQRRRTS